MTAKPSKNVDFFMTSQTETATAKQETSSIAAPPLMSWNKPCRLTISPEAGLMTGLVRVAK